MEKNSKIHVAGHRGLVGSAIVRKLESEGYTNIIVRSSNELDLKNQTQVDEFFSAEKPEYVFLAAAKVGGIHANNIYPAEFIYENLMIQNNVIHQSYVNKVKKLLFLGSSCIYPKFAPQPMKEDDLLTGILEPTNEPYAIAKISGIEMCWAYNRQYGTDFIPVMPTNLYGPGDNFDLENSHVLPALIRKFHEAMLSKSDSVTVWGTGTPKREFLYVDDLADACVFVMKKDTSEYKLNRPLFNIGTGSDVSIYELAELVKKNIGFKGEIIFDSTKPDGTPRKLMDVSKIKNMGWQSSTSIENGIEKTYAWFIENQSEIRK